MARLTKAQKAEREESVAELRGILKPGMTVYTNLRRVSRSGMRRLISVHVVQGGEMRDISFHVARATDTPFDRDAFALKVDGCGMDMGFHVVYHLSRVLFPDGFGERGRGKFGHAIRPATREMAEKAVKAGVVFHGRNGDTSGWDNDGGYALRQRWL